MRITEQVWLALAALLGITAVVGLARSETSSTSVKIWDAAFYDSEDCSAGKDVEIACPRYPMKIQGKAFTSDIQNECDRQLSDTGVPKCTIPVDMKYFRDKWGLHDPSVHHHKSMWIDYECNAGSVGSKRIRAFGEEATDTHPDNHINMVCD
jgi:hypothetical protein